MQIFGDLAVPNQHHVKKIDRFFIENNNIFEGRKKIINLEGLLDDSEINLSNPVIYNYQTIAKVLKNHNIDVACLANNHTLDLPGKLDSTVNKLNNLGIKSIGANNPSSTKNDWINWEEDEKEIYLYNACWDFLLYIQKNPSDFGESVNVINEIELLNEIRELKRKAPEAIIITYFHWSFDLETLPSPSYRKFAHDLIDLGVDLVVGTHAHCIQPIELYKDSYIIYGLGNFYFPNDIYFQGKLRFPDWAGSGLFVDYNIEKNLLLLHQFEIGGSNENYQIKYKKVINPRNQNDLIDISGMTDNEYLGYYIQNRRKRKFLLVFKDYSNSFNNKLKYAYLKMRVGFARKLAVWGLRNWQN